MNEAADRATRRHAYAGLHVLADDDPRWRQGPVEQARAACRGGAQVVQLRAKHSGDAQVLEWAAEIRSLTREWGARFVVNDRFDLALAAGADAVHLGQGDLAPGDLPEDARARLAIGRSTHTLDQALDARKEGVDYVAFGPVFGTESKASEYSRRGLEALAHAARIVAPMPMIAIGGIGADAATHVMGAGAAGFAVISAVAGATDATATTRQLVDSIRAAAAKASSANDAGQETS